MDAIKYILKWLQINMYVASHYNNIYVFKLPVLGHSKHCPGEANDTPDNS